MLANARINSARAYAALPPEQQSAILTLAENAAVRDADHAVLSLEEAEALTESKEIANEVKPPPNAGPANEPVMADPDADTKVAPAADVEAALNDEMTDIGASDKPAVNDHLPPTSLKEIKVGNRTVRFTLGKPFGAGASSEVFRVLKIDGIDVSEPLVIKLAKNHSDFPEPRRSRFSGCGRPILS